MRKGIASQILALAVIAGVAASVPTGVASATGRARRCSAQGTSSTDVMPGTPVRDRVCAGGGNDVVETLGGNDLVWLGAGTDSAEGDRGNDRLFGGGGNDTLEGGPGFDVLNGGGGDDVLHAADGNGGDLVIGGPGQDRCVVNQDDRTRGCETVRMPA